MFGPNGIDAALGELPFAPTGLVDGVHPLGPTITIRQLLTHTSGMKDMQTDDATGTADQLGRPAPDSVMTNFWRSARGLAAGDRSDEFALHRWMPWDPAAVDDPMAGMLNRFLATGTAATPVGAPGERFHYSDTAYVLLGVLVELATGRGFAELQRERISDPLGLVDTTLAYHDDAGDGAGVMDVWLGDIALLSAGPRPVVRLGWRRPGQHRCRPVPVPAGPAGRGAVRRPGDHRGVHGLGASGGSSAAAPRGGSRSAALAGRTARAGGPRGSVGCARVPRPDVGGVRRRHGRTTRRLRVAERRARCRPGGTAVKGVQ